MAQMRVLDSKFPPNPATINRVRAWLREHPGATVDEVAAGVLPDKTPHAVLEILLAMRGQCRVHRDGERWYPAG